MYGVQSGVLTQSQACDSLIHSAYKHVSVKPVKAELHISKAEGGIGHQIKKIWEVTTSIFSRIISVILFPIKWLVENRFGIAKLVGFSLVPSQFDSICDSRQCIRYVNALCQKTFTDGRYYERIHVKDGSTALEAVICYPTNWNKESGNSDCVVFNNPNAMLLSDLFDSHDRLDDAYLSGILQRIKSCPVIIYDYRGTGLNKTSSAPWPTVNTIVQDSTAVLKCAADRFGQVTMAGTSLGGVGTISLGKALNTTDKLTPDRISLINHASFTTTARVVLPDCSWFADGLGWLVGGNLNALKPIKKLMDRKVSITVMNNLKDPVIPEGARMADSVRESVVARPKLRVVDDCQSNAHVELTEKFRSELINHYS